jgi:Zn finger protein HypA/HybF involved in hydrogenase expression
MNSATWESAALPRVQFFGWLLSRDRIQSKANLLLKTITGDATCELCNSTDETAEHIIFKCPFACSFWVHLGFWGSDKK